MEFQTIPKTETVDILSLLDYEEVVVQEEIQKDPLAQMESILIENTTSETIAHQSKKEVRESLLTRFRRASAPKIQFLFYYLSISTIVFIILLATTNWNSYSAILTTYLDPKGLTESKNDIISVLNKSRVTVYADNAVEV
jgi:hypothetical protein